jgi:hypothetical protein
LILQTGVFIVLRLYYIEMSESQEIIQGRMPVWNALSELFLDTELQDADYLRIAKVLALSPYSNADLWEILRFEVYPPCRLNLLCVAGAWGTFGDEWIMERIAPHCGKRPKIRWPMLFGWTFQREWRKVQDLVAEMRSSKQRSVPR